MSRCIRFLSHAEFWADLKQLCESCTNLPNAKPSTLLRANTFLAAVTHPQNAENVARKSMANKLHGYDCRFCTFQ